VTAGAATPLAITRDFTVAVFVVRDAQVLLHWHTKLGRWLPPGGHIEPDELPDDAARREVLEETGVAIALTGATGIDHSRPGEPIQLVRPEGVQVETIHPGHEHIDLIYFARPLTDPTLPPRVGWYGAANLDSLNITDEVRLWCEKAIATMGAVAPRS
jgi:8-oxo-dGTP pyrophosphatase MutT (NUDIX family)